MYYMGRMTGTCVVALMLCGLSPPVWGQSESTQGGQPRQVPDAQQPEIGVQFETPGAAASVQRSPQGITVDAVNASADLLIAEIARQAGIDVILKGSLRDTVTLHLKGVSAEQAIRVIAASSGALVVREGGTLRILQLNEAVQWKGGLPGIVVRTFRLRFARASDIKPILESLRSPVGEVQAIESQPMTSIEQNSADILETGDIVIVRDLPEYVEKIAKVIGEIDVPPPQVLIEARVLEVRLKKGYHTGFQFLSELEPGDKKLTIAVRGLANALSDKGFVATLEASELTAILDLLESTADAKTLAAPRVLVTHGQQARIQIGRSLSYRVLTVTEVAQVEDVKFLDTGIVLRFVPYVDPAGRILLRVRPEVSQGEINEQTGLPDKSTTEAETTVVLNDGRGVVIGGLIQEATSDTRSKVRRLGDLPLIGKLFRRDQVDRERREIVIALIPHIYPYLRDASQQYEEEMQLDRVSYPLVDEHLRPLSRPWEYGLDQPKPDELFDE